MFLIIFNNSFGSKKFKEKKGNYVICLIFDLIDIKYIFIVRKNIKKITKVQEKYFIHTKTYKSYF